MIPVSGTRLALLAALAVCLVAGTAAQAQNLDSTGCTKVGPASVCTTLNTAKISFSSTKPTTARIYTSFDKSYGLLVLDRRFKTTHSITIRSLTASTGYNIKLAVTPKTGKTAIYTGSFRTADIGSVPATVTAGNGWLLLNGVRFFPIVGLTGACLKDSDKLVDKYVAMGTNILQDVASCDGNTDNWPDELGPMLGNKSWVDARTVGPAQVKALQAVPQYLDWQAPARLLQNPSSLLRCTGTLASSAPLYAAVKNESGKGITMYMATLANHGTPTETPYCLDGTGMRNLFFTAVIANAQGLVYFPYIPVTGQLDVLDDVAKAAKASAQCMSTLGPAILNGTHLQLQTTSGSVKAAGWIYGGVTYIAAVNTERTAVSSTISLLNPRSTTAQTECEPSRTLKLVNGSLSDHFSPLAVHFYRVAP